MDLLGGGDSSDDDDSHQSETATDKLPDTAGASAKSAAAAVTPQGPHVSRARKLLSLQNVLPRHILERLTRSEVQGESSEDEDDIPRKPVPTKKPLSRGNDSQMANFLSELKAAPSTAPLERKDKGKSPEPSEKLGAAFLTSTTTVVKKSNIGIRDIHNEATPAPGKAKESESLSAEPDTGSTSLKVARLSQVNLAPSIRSSAPPPVIDNLAVHQPINNISSKTQQERQSPPAPSRKRSRKEIEKALRSGDLNLEDQETQTIQPSTPQYQPQEQTYAVPVHGVKVSSTTMYDPSAGEAVSGRSGGRNQINQLMKQAASLELNRARGLDGSGAQKGKLQRANAKRKYGW